MLNEQNSTEVRDKIICAARTLFAKKGLKGTTVRNIAATSGTNVAMVNYYFRSKNNLFDAILDEAFNVLAGKVFTAIDSDLPFFEMVQKWVYSYYDTLMEYPQLPLFVLNELTQHPESLTNKLKASELNRVYNRLITRIKEEEEKGTIKKISAHDFFLNIVSLSVFPFIAGPIANSVLQFSIDSYEELLRNHKEYVVKFIIDAIKIED